MDSAAVVIVIGGALAAMLKEAVADWVGDELSVAFKVKVDEPAIVGVPEITPEEESVRPVGKDPDDSENA